jgi:hypothetical protein
MERETYNCEFCDEIMQPAEHAICDICGDCLDGKKAPQKFNQKFDIRRNDLPEIAECGYTDFVNEDTGFLISISKGFNAVLSHDEMFLVKWYDKKAACGITNWHYTKEQALKMCQKMYNADIKKRI